MECWCVRCQHEKLGSTIWRTYSHLEGTLASEQTARKRENGGQWLYLLVLLCWIAIRLCLVITKYEFLAAVSMHAP